MVQTLRALRNRPADDKLVVGGESADAADRTAAARRKHGSSLVYSNDLHMSRAQGSLYKVLLKRSTRDNDSAGMGVIEVSQRLKAIPCVDE